MTPTKIRLLLGYNLVPRGRDPFVQRRGSITFGRIRKDHLPLAEKNRVYHMQIYSLIEKPCAR